MTPEQQRKLDLLAEADRRGILTGPKKAAYDEYLKRQGAAPTSAASTGYEASSNNPLDPLLSGATFSMSDEIIGGIGATYAAIHNMLTGSQENKLFPDKNKGFPNHYSFACFPIRII